MDAMMKPINDHLQAEELFSAYIDNRVTADEKSFVERHTAVCADCHARLQAARSLVAALRAMPVVKAPRSFVLPRKMPREMARQPQRSILAWYPALRLATALAVVAFVLVFAGDLFASSYGSGMNMPPAVPQAALMAPTAIPAMITKEVAVAQATNAPTPTVVAKLMDQTQSADATSAAGAQLSAPQPASALPTATSMLPAAGAAPASSAARSITSTGEVTGARASAPQATPTTEPASDAATAVPANGAAPIDPLRLIEIVLGGLVIILGVATLIVRQRAA
jgi:Putative zinc-finger